MIIYFSGTGNSRYAALRIAGRTGEEAVNAAEYIRRGEKADFACEKPYVFVCPVYAWRMPRVMERFIREGSFGGSRRAYFVLTCGSGIGGAQRYLEALCAAKEFEFMGAAKVVMPENYVAMFPVPNEEKARGIIKKAQPFLDEAAERILRGEKLRPCRGGVLGAVLSGPVNPGFYSHYVSAKKFYATDACTGCGVCVRACALNNVRLQAGRPVWGENCTHCMACICRCPQKAVEYGRKSVGKPRYLCPDMEGFS